MACFLPRSPVKELSKQIAPRLTEFDVRLERLEAKNESASKELASASEACQHQQQALHDMLLAWPTSTLVRQALCHHAENLQQRNRSEDALPLLEKAMKEAAKAGIPISSLNPDTDGDGKVEKWEVDVYNRIKSADSDQSGAISVM